MTAGRGITHSERSPAARARGPELSGIQTWLALPTAKEEIEPAFEHVGRRTTAGGRGRRPVRAW